MYEDDDFYSIKCEECGEDICTGYMAFDIDGRTLCNRCAIDWLNRNFSFPVEYPDEEERQKIYAVGF